jgi:hypothetical protein
MVAWSPPSFLAQWYTVARIKPVEVAVGGEVKSRLEGRVSGHVAKAKATTAALG